MVLNCPLIIHENLFDWIQFSDISQWVFFALYSLPDVVLREILSKGKVFFSFPIQGISETVEKLSRSVFIPLCSNWVNHDWVFIRTAKYWTGHLTWLNCWPAFCMVEMVITVNCYQNQKYWNMIVAYNVPLCSHIWGFFRFFMFLVAEFSVNNSNLSRISLVLCADCTLRMPCHRVL